jgi:hypothetical protein
VVSAAGRPLPPVEAEGIAELIAQFVDSPLCERLARARDVRREERFAFLLADEVLVTGALDVLAREPEGRMLVVDYKSDRLDGGDPRAIVERQYATQRLVYALATLRAGAAEVEIAHVFLEAPREVVSGRPTPPRSTAGSNSSPRVCCGGSSRSPTSRAGRCAPDVRRREASARGRSR